MNLFLLYQSKLNEMQYYDIFLVNSIYIYIIYNIRYPFKIFVYHLF
jgi:hypothetical protein